MWETISNEPLKSLLIWASVFSCTAFYMQRLHYQDPHLRGSLIPGPQLMATGANLMGWVALLSAGYIWYRLGWFSAFVYLVIPFAAGMVFMQLEMKLLRVSMTTLALASTPVTIVAFGVLMWKLAHL